MKKSFYFACFLFFSSVLKNRIGLQTKGTFVPKFCPSLDFVLPSPIFYLTWKTSESLAATILKYLHTHTSGLRCEKVHRMFVYILTKKLLKQHRTSANDTTLPWRQMRLGEIKGRLCLRGRKRPVLAWLVRNGAFLRKKKRISNSGQNVHQTEATQKAR